MSCILFATWSFFALRRVYCCWMLSKHTKKMSLDTKANCRDDGGLKIVGLSLRGSLSVYHDRLSNWIWEMLTTLINKYSTIFITFICTVIWQERTWAVEKKLIHNTCKIKYTVESYCVRNFTLIIDDQISYRGASRAFT